MKVNAGIITEKLAESKAFYIDNLDFGVTFETSSIYCYIPRSSG